MRTTLLTVPLAFALVAVACHHAAPPQVTAEPTPDLNAMADRDRQDSIARAEAEARAREEAERLARRRADSLAQLQRTAEEIKAVLATTIHFDFDKSDIRPGDAQTLDQKVPILRGNPSIRIRIAGNCDERGSDEYNLALGNRRAVSAKSYLVSHGIDASRIETISNGEEHPIDPGHNEEAWAMNRNDQFTVLNTDVVLRLP
jgi:peptidoglycan-associated lipoprotein